MALSDAPAIQRHFNNWNIIRNLAMVVPWPYPNDGAESFVRRELAKIAPGEEIYHWVLVLRASDGEAIGNIDFRPKADGRKGNRGFWLAELWWNQGLMTEATAAVNDFAFLTLGLLRLQRRIQCRFTPGQAKTGAEFVGLVELPHHNGESKAEKWKVTCESWLSCSR